MSQVPEEKKDQVVFSVTTIDITRILQWSGKKIRIIGTVENPWFHATDVANAIELTNVSKSLTDHVRSRNKSLGVDISRSNDSLDLDRYEKQAYFINEAGLYSLIMQSKKKEAEIFQDWVTDVVLPSIRKTGSYQINEQVQRLTSELATQKLITDESTRIAEEQKRIAEETQKIAEDAQRIAEEQKRIAAEALFKAETEQKRADDAESEAKSAKKEKLESDVKHKDELEALESTSAKTRCAYKEQLQTRNQRMYAITNDQNKAKDMYKVGRTKNHTGARVTTLNTGLISNESLYCVATYDCADACSVEDRVHKLLAPFRDSITREFFQIPFAKLHTLITIVIKHQSDEYDLSCILVDEVIGRPMRCGKDADEYLAAIAAANMAIIVPLETNETLAHEAMKEWIVLQQPIADGLDWIKYQTYLRTFLERKKIPKIRYRAREWKDLSTAAFNTIRATLSVPAPTVVPSV